MPALGMVQDTGKLIAWLKQEGESVTEGEAIMEIETDKATVEIEAAGSGVLSGVSAAEGDDIPVGQTIAWILAPGEALPELTQKDAVDGPAPAAEKSVAVPNASPVAQKVAAEYGVELTKVKGSKGRIQKADVLAYIETQAGEGGGARLSPASPKARRLAQERSIDITMLAGSGPGYAVLTTDVPLTIPSDGLTAESIPVSTIWGIMAERVTQSWRQAPHFYLVREVNADPIIAWRTSLLARYERKITYTDLLVKLVAAALRRNPRVNASWDEETISIKHKINLGLAVAIENGLTVPVIHQADELGLVQIAERRQDLVTRAQNSKLRPEDLQNGTFTISNLGMYGVDAFIPILNPPQAAILGVGRIIKRVVPVNDQPIVQSRMTLTVSFDHRAVDGAQGAEFLETLANLIEEPFRLVE
jgi:pyruvate dehydrogenase E2 component (dihydrolipoamide acetyltransferase)